MGFASCLGTCFGCGGLFHFNPNIVPSIRVKGVKEPVCESCVKRANPEREKNGLEPIVIREGAYEAADESEVF